MFNLNLNLILMLNIILILNLIIVFNLIIILNPILILQHIINLVLNLVLNDKADERKENYEDESILKNNYYDDQDAKGQSA